MSGSPSSRSSSNRGTPGLRRDVGLTLFALYGTGNIIGAGIYVLVGKVAGEAGLLAPLAFVVAAVIAGLTGLSYGELAARHPVSAGEAVYLHKAFGRRWLSVSAGLLIALAGLVSAATMARGFVGYFNQFVSANEVIVIVVLISALTLIAVRGIAESARVAAALTLVEAGGLLWIILAAAPDATQLAEVPVAEFFPADMPAWQGVFAAAFLAFFAFIGFEDMVSIAEEVHEPERNMPRGIMLAFAISTTLYLLVTIVSIAVLPIAELAASGAPLADVYRAATGGSIVIISVIGLVAVINGALIQIIKAARVFYGMACNGWLPGFFGIVNARTRTPLRSTVIAGGLVLVLALLLPLVSLAKITSAMVLVVFTLVNIALLRIKRSGPPPEGVRSMPAWVPLLGALASAGILLGGLLGASSANAHVPYIEIKDYPEGEDFVITDVDQSKAFYAYLDAGDIDGFEIVLAEPGRIYINSLIPFCREYAYYDVSLALIGDGLDEPSVELPVELADGQGAIVLPARTADWADRPFMYEMFSDRRYFDGPRYTLRAAPAGTYRLIAWHPDGTAGDYIAIVGRAESFGPSDMRLAVINTPIIRRMEEMKSDCESEGNFAAWFDREE